MPEFETGFARRVRTTTGLVAALGFFTLLAWQPATDVLLSYLSGVAVALLLWWSAERLIARLGGPDGPQGSQWLAVIGLYLGKYVAAGLLIWALQRTGLLQPAAFAGGFSIPVFTVMLKAIGLRSLAAEVDPHPYYARRDEPQ